MADLAVLLRALEEEIDRLAAGDPALAARLERAALKSTLDALLRESSATGRLELGVLWGHLEERGVDEGRRKSLLRALTRAAVKHDVTVTVTLPAVVTATTTGPIQALGPQGSPAPVDIPGLSSSPEAPSPAQRKAPPAPGAPASAKPPAPSGFAIPPTTGGGVSNALNETLRQVFARSPELAGAVTVGETRQVLATQGALADEDTPVDLTPLFLHLQAAGVPEATIHEALLALASRGEELGVAMKLPRATAAIAPEFRTQILEAFWAIPPTPAGPAAPKKRPPAATSAAPAPARGRGSASPASPPVGAGSPAAAFVSRLPKPPVLLGAAGLVLALLVGVFALFAGEDAPRLVIDDDDLPCREARPRGRVLLCVMERGAFVALPPAALSERTGRTTRKARELGFEGLLLVDENEDVLLTPEP